MTVTLIIIALVVLVVGLFPIVLHLVYRAPRLVENKGPESLSLPYTSEYLQGPNGKRLFAWSIPGEEEQATVILAHGWGGNAQVMLPLVEPFHQIGMNLLLYDARNHGKSDGDSFSSLPRFAEDLGCAVDCVKQRYPGKPVVVLGHSIGAAAALLAASHRTDIDLVISIAGFAHPRLVMQRHLHRPWLPGFLRPLIIEYIQWVIGYRFDEIAPMNRIEQIACPVLLAHGTEDQVVPISDMRLMEQNAGQKTNLVLLPIDGAHHHSVKAFKQHAHKLISFIQSHLGE